jgi:hypothetical protein
MKKVGKRQQQARDSGLLVLSLIWMIAVAASPAVAEDFSFHFTGLHDLEVVSGLDITTATPNQDNYSLTASGDDSGSYANTLFSAYGLYSSTSASIQNTGTLAVTAQGGIPSGDAFVSSGVSVSGIYTQNNVDNSGGISVDAKGGSASFDGSSYGEANVSAYAQGISTDNDFAEVSNSGAIQVGAQAGSAGFSGDTSSAFGTIYAEAFAHGIATGGAVDNSGTITVTATAGSASPAAGLGANVYADATGWGLYSWYGSVTNSGDISLTVTGGTVELTEPASSMVDGIADTHVFAYGVYTGGDADNSGDIQVTATGGTATGYGWAATSVLAFGMDGEGSGSNVTNSGDILVDATSGTATATGTGSFYADSSVSTYGIGTNSGDIAVTNSGDIRVNAVAGDAYASSAESGAAYASATAYGILANGAVTNEGDIRVNAEAGNADASASFFGADAVVADATAYGISTGGSVSNSGDMQVIAAAQDGFDSTAYGVYMTGSGSLTLTNTGIIHVDADTAYEVGIMNSGASVTLVDDYRLNLDGDPDTGSIFVADGATLDLNDAVLSVSSVGGTTVWNTEYKIFETASGTVTGSFSALTEPLNPVVAITYHDQDTAGSVDDTVSLSYQPEESSPFVEADDLALRTARLTGDLVNQQMIITFLQPRVMQTAALRPQMYADAKTVATDALPDRPGSAGRFFLTPYFSNVDKEASPVGYDVDMEGFVAGYERETGNNTLYGFHLGYGHAQVDFTGSGYNHNQEDQDLMTVGVHAMGSRGPWTLRGHLTGFYGWQDYDGLTGIDLETRESADYDSYGVTSSLMGGYMVQLGSHILLPEIGLDYVWFNRESFTTDTNDSGWDVHCDSLDEHQLASVASLRWLTRQQFGDMVMTPSVAVGVRYLLTDNDIDMDQSVSGSAPVAVKAEQDDVTGTVSASILLSQDRLGTELAYDGEYGDDVTRHSMWLRLHYRF